MKKKGIRTWAAAILIGFLALALILPSIPGLLNGVTSTDGGGPNSVAKLIKRVDPFIRANVANLDGAVTDELAFSFSPSTGAIGGYNLTLLTGAVGAWRAFTIYGRDNGNGLEDVDQEYSPVSPTRDAIILADGVPLADVATVIDKIGLRKLIAGGDLAIAQLSVQHDAGNVYISDAATEVLVVDAKGKTRALAAGEAAVVTGRTVMLSVWRTEGLPDGTSRERAYLLEGLSGAVTVVTAPTIALPADEQLLALHRGDLNADGAPEYVLLTGKGAGEGENTAPRQRYLRLIADDGQLGAPIAVPGSPSIYGTYINLRDLTGDGRLELIVQESQATNDGALDLNIFSLVDGALRPLFRAAEQHRPAGVRSEYIAGGTVRTTVPTPKHVWEYPYLLDQVGGDEALVTSRFTADWVDPVQAYDFADLNGDGRIEIIGRQPICGTARADVIAELRQIFAFDGTRFSRSDVELYTAFDLNLVLPKE